MYGVGAWPVKARHEVFSRAYKYIVLVQSTASVGDRLLLVGDKEHACTFIFLRLDPEIPHNLLVLRSVNALLGDCLVFLSCCDLLSPSVCRVGALVDLFGLIRLFVRLLIHRGCVVFSWLMGLLSFMFLFRLFAWHGARRPPQLDQPGWMHDGKA